MSNIPKHQLNEAAEVLQRFLNDETIISRIVQSGKLLADALSQGYKVLSCGNGGSMSDSMHFAEELVGKFREKREALPAIALGSDPALTSCIANDYGYENLFERGVKAYGRPGDVLVGISTSGNSRNVIKAIEAARQKNLWVIGLTGKDGGEMAGLCDSEIRVPHFGYADRIQEIHIKVIHIFIAQIEEEMGLN